MSQQIGYRSFKWGTKHWFWSRGCKDIRGQSWRSKKISAHAPDSRPMHPGPAVSADIFFDLQLWPLISLQPLDQNQCLVPHLKDLLRICLEVKAQSFWKTFKVLNLASKQPYFNSVYVVRLPIFSFTTVPAKQLHRSSQFMAWKMKCSLMREWSQLKPYFFYILLCIQFSLQIDLFSTIRFFWHGSCEWRKDPFFRLSLHTVLHQLDITL